jgi:predicted NAD-dependent protein-ADP-ribosyltransferase YbiA (DUF1768 family)
MSTRFTISSDLCSASDRDGTIVLSVEKGILYSLIGVGSLTWTALTEHPQGLTVDEIVASIQKVHGTVPQEQIKRDIEKLLSQLTGKGLVEASDTEATQIAGSSQTYSNILGIHLVGVVIRLTVKLRLTSLAAFLQLCFFERALRLRGFRALHSLVREWPVAAERNESSSTVQRACEAVDRAARYHLRQTLCLQRSAVLTCLLRSHGVPAEMVIACRRIPFKGHAWVEVRGKVVNDSQRVQSFCSSVLARC